MSDATGLPALDNTMGALFVGVLTAMGLWGVGCVQLYYYLTTYGKDELWIKGLVLAVWSLDTTHQGMISHSLYEYLVTHYAHPAQLLEVVPTLLHEVMISALICAMVQCFLVMRVWRLSHKNIWITAFLLLLVAGELSVSIAYYAKGLPLSTFAAIATIVDLSRAINILAAISDVAIALTLILLLQRSRTGFKRSETIINRLILFTINTGALTSVSAIMSLITITVWPDTFVYITFFVNMSRLYTNTLFATLNARKSVRSGFGDTDDAHAQHTTASVHRMRPLDATKFGGVFGGAGGVFGGSAGAGAGGGVFGGAGGGGGLVGGAAMNGTRGQALTIKVDTETTRDDGLGHPGAKTRGGSDSDISSPYYHSALKSELPI